jgi:hypothetical protein
VRAAGHWVDRHWAFAVSLGLGGAIAAAYAIWTELAKHDPLLARLSPSTRTSLYESVASSSGALLGFSIAALAILFTLDPARPLVRRAQEHQLWGMLNKTLLVAAGSLALTLVASTVALAIDGHTQPRVPIELVVFTLTVVAFLELTIAGIAFALIVLVTASDV